MYTYSVADNRDLEAAAVVDESAPVTKEDWESLQELSEEEQRVSIEIKDLIKEREDIYNRMKDDKKPTGAVKNDEGKVGVNSTLSEFPRALWSVAEAGTFGYKKYETWTGWADVEDAIARYSDARERHKLHMNKGELIDKNSGLPHEFLMAWNTLAVLELKLRRGDYK